MSQPDPAAPDRATSSPPTREFTYVEQLVRHQLSASLGGARGMLEGAAPFVAFTIVWLLVGRLYPALGAALAAAVVLGVVRLIQRQSLRYVAQAVVPTAIAALVASRTGRAEDVFLPGILYNGALAVVSVVSIAVRAPLVGFIVGGATGDPTGWLRDRGMVRMTSRLTAVLAVPYLLRFVVQLPLFLAGNVVALAVAKIALGWPLLLGVVFVIGVMLSKGRTPIEPAREPTVGPAAVDSATPVREPNPEPTER